MKQLMVCMIGLTMVFTSSAAAQPPASSAGRNTAPNTVQLSAGGEVGKKVVNKQKMTKKTKKESAAQADAKAVVK